MYTASGLYVKIIEHMTSMELSGVINSATENAKETATIAETAKIKFDNFSTQEHNAKLIANKAKTDIDASENAKKFNSQKKVYINKYNAYLNNNNNENYINYLNAKKLYSEISGIIRDSETYKIYLDAKRIQTASKLNKEIAEENYTNAKFAADKAKITEQELITRRTLEIAKQPNNNVVIQTINPQPTDEEIKKFDKDLQTAMQSVPNFQFDLNKKLVFAMDKLENRIINIENKLQTI